MAEIGSESLHTKIEGRRSKPGVVKALRNRLVVWAALFFGWLVPRLPLGFVQFLGLILGRLGALLPGRRRRRVKEHLEIAYPKESIKPHERRRLEREAWIAGARMFLEAMWVSAWTPGRDDWRVKVQDADNWGAMLTLAKERGKGLIIMTSHLGAPEILGRWFVEQCGMPVMAVAARPKLTALEKPMIERRQASGLKLVFRGDAGTATVRHLKRGGALIVLADHNLKGRGIAVPFLGGEAHTLLAPAKLALQTGAVVNTVSVLRDGVGRFSIRCDPPMVPPPLQSDKDAQFRQEAELTCEYCGRLERMIRRYPEQYLWMHKRWQKRSDTLPLPC